MMGCSANKYNRTNTTGQVEDMALNQEKDEIQETVAEIIELDYNKQDMRVLVPIDETMSISPIKDIYTVNYRLMLYAVKSDDDNLSIGIWIKDLFYPIGKVTGKGLADDVEVKEVQVNKQHFVHIEGSFGAISPITYYLSMDHEPMVYIDGDLPVIIMDLDDDGTVEWVSGYFGRVSIYKMIEDEWYRTHVSDAVGKDMLFISETKTFHVQERNGATYQFVNDQLKLVKPSHDVQE